MGNALNGFGVWILSILCTIAAPVIPLLIEFLKSGAVKSDSFFITAAVLAAAFAVSAGHVLYRSAYLTLFVFNLILDMATGPYSATIEPYAGWLLLLVAVLHLMERFWWHVVLDQVFP